MMIGSLKFVNEPLIKQMLMLNIIKLIGIFIVSLFIIVSCGSSDKEIQIGKNKEREAWNDVLECRSSADDLQTSTYSMQNERLRLKSSRPVNWSEEDQRIKREIEEINSEIAFLRDEEHKLYNKWREANAELQKLDY